MFYSNALSVRRILLKIKKEARSIRRRTGKERVAGGYEGARKKEPDQFEGGGKKKSAGGRWLVSCSGTLLLLDDEVIDKLFGF